MCVYILDDIYILVSLYIDILWISKHIYIYIYTFNIAPQEIKTGNPFLLKAELDFAAMWPHASIAIAHATLQTKLQWLTPKIYPFNWGLQKQHMFKIVHKVFNPNWFLMKLLSILNISCIPQSRKDI